MKGYVYILEDKRGTYYVGSSAKPDERLARHTSGWVHTTARMESPKRVFLQEFETIEEAKKIELKLKRLKRKDYIKKIVRDGYIKMQI